MALLPATKQSFLDSIRDYSCTGIMKEMGHFFPPLLNRIMRVINGEEAFFLYNVMYRGSLY